MDIQEVSEKLLTRINSPRLSAAFEKAARRIPAVQAEIEASYAEIMGEM
jgi:hypothetical protein